jgi:uncharacterized LabA/DUF88 family protein
MAEERVAVFIDGKSMVALQQKTNLKLDFRKVLDTIQEQVVPDSLIHNSFYYIGINSKDVKKHSFATALTYMGMTVRSKDIYTDDEEEMGGEYWDSRKAPVNLDFDLAADIFSCTKMCDTFVFMVGHIMMAPIIELLRHLGKETILFSTNDVVYTDLVNRVDSFVEIKDYEKHVAKDGSHLRYEEDL